MVDQTLAWVENVENAAVLQPQQLPAFQGDEIGENLLCGRCNAVIGRNVSAATISSKMVGENGLYVRCTCGAHNLIPA